MITSHMHTSNRQGHWRLTEGFLEEAATHLSPEPCESEPAKDWWQDLPGNKKSLEHRRKKHEVMVSGEKPPLTSAGIRARERMGPVYLMSQCPEVINQADKLLRKISFILLP